MSVMRACAGIYIGRTTEVVCADGGSTPVVVLD